MRPPGKLRILDDAAIRKLVFDPQPKRPNPGLVGSARGEYTERRVALLALQCPGVHSVRRGTTEEDHDRGIDLVVRLCSGDFKLLQVKSSRSKSGKARASATKAIRNGAEVVCVPIDMPDHLAKHRIMIALGLAIPDAMQLHSCDQPGKKKRQWTWSEKQRKNSRRKWREKRRVLRVHTVGVSIMRWEDDGGKPYPEER